MTLKAGMDESGVVLFVDVDVYSDSGFSFAEDTAEYVALTWKVFFKTLYYSKSYTVRPWDTLFLDSKKHSIAQKLELLIRGNSRQLRTVWLKARIKWICLSQKNWIK